MCAVSMIGDYYTQHFQQQSGGAGLMNVPQVSKQEFEQLKKEVETMKELLIRAKLYDETTGQKDCEMEEKVALLKKVAEFVGVDLSSVFKEGEMSENKLTDWEVGQDLIAIADLISKKESDFRSAGRLELAKLLRKIRFEIGDTFKQLGSNN